jgi:thymidylate synthase ThyX
MNKGIDVEIIKDSTNWTGHRLTTYVLKYPRYIHSELMTHRVFSKNSASSRAIPYNKMKENILEDPVMPIWTANQSGMQGKFITDEKVIEELNENWLCQLDDTILRANGFFTTNVHKQNVNRLLEPWMHIKIILTGTDFDNWFTLRYHPDAQPEIQELARKMLEAMKESKPEYLEPGQWHIPFSDDLASDEVIQRSYKLLFANSGWTKEPTKEEMFEHGINTALNRSVARCARVSYNNVDGTGSTIEKDLELFQKLLVSEPLHASPAEHQAQVPYPKDYVNGHMSVAHELGFNSGPYDSIPELWKKAVYENETKGLALISKKGKYFSNLQGWIQYRKILEEQKLKK